MIPAPLLLVWRYRKWIGIIAGAVALVWLIWAQVDAYGDRRAKSAREAVQALWDADTLARQAATDKAIADAKAKEDAARAANEVIEDEYQAKLVAAAGERDGYYRMLQQARNQVRAVTSREATSAVIAATAGEASIADRIDRAVAGVIVEHRANSDQLDALIAVVKPQM